MKRLETLAIIAHDMGIIFEFLGGITLVPLLVLVLFSEWGMLLPMATVPATFFFLGLLISHIPRREYVPQLSVALAAVALTWLAVAVIGAFPFVLGLGMSWTDSIFEAMSGWTGTGFSVIHGLESVPKTLLFWRSFMQWVGGIGVIAFGIAMLSRSGLTQHQLYRAEGRPEDLMPSVVSTGRRMWVIYAFLTLVFTGMVMLAGIPLWDALNLVMVTLATGGFSLHDAGILYYHNPLLEALLIPVMLAGALPFKLYFFIYRGRIQPFLQDRVVWLILALALAGSLVVTLDLHLFMGMTLGEAARQGFFCTVSGLTCCGLQNSDLRWVASPLIVISLLMMIGGAAGSTSGGIKANRIILAYEGLVWWFRRFFARGRVVVPFRHEGRAIPKRITDVELSKNMLIVVLYVLTIFLATIVCLHLAPTEFRTHEVIFEEISAMSNVGLGLGYLTPASPDPVKWVFTFLMWTGRLEIIPVLILAVGLIRGFEPRVGAR
ncbi:MAG: TrkH family potassium uptake protein [Methanolinea sp.]|nr:TrkH family potassium uptake protein [Methanolinea sp.]